MPDDHDGKKKRKSVPFSTFLRLTHSLQIRRGIKQKKEEEKQDD